MSRNPQTQVLTSFRRAPRLDVKRRFTLSSPTLLRIALAIFATTSTLLGVSARVVAQNVPTKARAYVNLNETTQNGRCFQKTFPIPTDKDADLVGTFIMRLLSDDLRAQTTWRFDEEANTITIYGPEKAIEISEKFLNDFSVPLFESFLSSGEFVSVAGVSATTPQRATTNPQPQEEARNVKYYDPNRNEVVRVAYEANGAVMPDQREYATSFGGGETPQDPKTVATPRPTLQSAAAPVANAGSNDDLMLDVLVYRCPPTLCEQIAQLVKREFESNLPEIALNADSRLGAITVHTNRKIQREVRAFLAKLQVYPAQCSVYDSELRVASGTISPITGGETKANGLPAPTIPSANSETLDASISDVYAPQYRKADELHDALLQLFGDRFIRLQTDPNAPFSERQTTTYRLVKRVDVENPDAPSQARKCDVSIDPLHNRLGVQGDPAMCSQMLVLLRAMDQPPLRNGNVRKFIPIRNGDSKKLRQIFEYDAQNTASRPQASLNWTTLYRIADEMRRDNVDALRYLDSRRSLAEKLEPIFNDLVPSERRETLASVASPRGYTRPLDDAFNAVAEITSRPQRVARDRVRQVAYQEGDLGDIGAAVDVGPGVSPFNDYRGGRGGVGVVQDVNPSVLDAIDVVIIDNATDAEFQRIQQMIEQIEQLAKIAEAQTEIYNLKHVDCSMLHGVLTTLYTEMFSTKQGRVVFYPLQNPNAILVAGWGQAYEDMKSLIELFDQPIADGAGTFRVSRLKYASADEIAALLTETFLTPQTTGTGGLAPRIRVFADVRTNSLIIQASPNDWNEVQKLLLELDVNKADVKLVTKIIPLKNSLAENTRTTIMNVILSAKQGTLDTTAAKFPVLQLLSVDDSGKRLVESGVMMDVDIVADVYHNQLVVTAPEDCVEFMERLVELLDVAPKKAQIRFFQVRHGDATQILQTLQSLLATTDQNLSTPTLPQVDDEETFVPVRFGVDTRTNVIIAAAAPKELAIIDALIVALDVKDTGEREEVVVQLRNIQALVVAEAIDDYLAQKQTLETASEVLSTYQLYESQVIVIPESISNSIIVSASPEEMDKILRMIQTFDKDPPQVQIQVLIAEVTLSDQEEFGIEAGFQNSTSFDRSMITTTSSGSQTGAPGFDIIGGGGPGKNMATNINPTNIAGQVLNNFAMGTSDSSLGYGGFVISASSRSVQLTLRALREKNRLQVLSRPQVTAMDNQQAFILVGQRVPRINGTTTTNYGVQMNTTDTPVGLILLVTPRVTTDGKVVMEIGAEKSSLGNDSDATPIYSQGGEVIKSRSIDTIQTMTAISARDGETVMLGGLLTSTKEKISRGVPFVSDLPVVGRLFRYDQELEQRKELLIVMTPHIMRDSNDFAEVMRIEMSKMHVDLDEAMSINGNMGLYDPSTNQGCETKETKRILHEFVHPDKMDELDNLPPYSPERDYQPRPVVQPDPNPYSRASLRSSSRSSAPSSSNAPSPEPKRGSAQPTKSNLTEPAIPNRESLLDEEFYLEDVGDDFSSNSRASRREGDRETPRVASRLESTRASGAESGGRATPNASRINAEQNESQVRRASDLRNATAEEKEAPRGISAYRNRINAKKSEPRREEIDESNEETTRESELIRGQEPREFVAKPRRLFYWIDFNEPNPYAATKESDSFKLFHWTSLHF